MEQEKKGKAEAAESAAAEEAAVNETKHPLENSWTFWYDRRNNGGRRQKGEKNNWENNLKTVGDFATVEDFWRYFNNMKPASKLEANSNYHLFKSGVKPMWEDPVNAKGGKWIIALKGNRDKLDGFWEVIVLSVIGEAFETDDSDEICGCVMSRRKNGDRIAVWNRTKNNRDVIMTLGRKIKAALDVGNNTRIKFTYQVHEDALRSGASYTNPARYEL